MKLEKFDIPIETCIIPSDDPKKKLNVGWTVEEVQGIEIVKPYKNWIEEFGKKLARDGSWGDLVVKHAIRDVNGISIGDKVIVSHFFGVDEATVTEIDFKNRKGVAETEYTIYLLGFEAGKRNAWVSDGMINKKCLYNKFSE